MLSIDGGVWGLDKSHAGIGLDETVRTRNNGSGGVVWVISWQEARIVKVKEEKLEAELPPTLGSKSGWHVQLTL